MIKKLFQLLCVLAVAGCANFDSAGTTDDENPEMRKMGVEKISLDGAWTLSFAKQPDGEDPTLENFPSLKDATTIPAVVPGNAEIDMFRAKLIEDPTVGDNVFKLLKYEAYLWKYSREFPTPELKAGQRTVLNFGGIDTLADIYLNGKLVGKAENMFIAHEFDVTKLLNKSGANKLDVLIRSTPMEAAKFTPPWGIRNPVEFQNIRKAPASFGWDIHPRLMTAGIWKSVSLDIRNAVNIKDINIWTWKIDLEKKTADLHVDVRIDAPYSKFSELKMRVQLSRKGKPTITRTSPIFNYSTVTKFTDIADVDFWWPRGFGEAALYDVKIEVLDEADNVLARDFAKAGIRTTRLEFRELKLPEGDITVHGSGNVSGKNLKGKVDGEFKFYVNGVPVFIKGTNWVPLDASHSRDISHLKDVMPMLADLNCNMVRCWGGNVYESDEFYQACDELGIMVWQDFSFACSVYPQNEEFARKVGAEVSAVVKRLRKHPSIVLWAGNNEDDQLYLYAYRFGFDIKPDFDKLSRKVIPDAVRDLDWTRPYLPSSPFLSDTTLMSKKVAAPEVHLWGPRGYYKAPFYTDAVAVFVSEIGYHGCPNVESLRKMMHPEFVYPWTKDGKWNKEWLAKSVMHYPNSTTNIKRNDLMTNQVKIVFGEVPQKLEDFVFASQSVQGEAKKYFIEMMRSQKFDQKTGIIWWNLRDAWPILSDAVVDYYNSKKLAYHYIKRVQTDVCAMVTDAFEVVVANDTLKDSPVSVKITDADSGDVVFEKSATVPANAKLSLGKIAPRGGQGMLVIEYCTPASGKLFNHYLYGKPPFKLADYKRWFEKLGVK